MTIAEEAIASIRTVRGFNREDEEVNRFHYNNSKGQQEDLMICRFIVAMMGVMMIVIWGTIISLFYWGIKMVDDPKSGHTIGAVFACFGFQMMGDFGFIGTMGSFQSEEKAVTAGSRILKLAKYEPTVQFEGGETIPDFKGHLEFRNVSFKYPTREAYVLQHVSFEVQPGQIAALVGHSGSGKSTCVQLIERFYDPTEGEILLDGKDIRTLDPRWLHRQISLVSQEPVLFRTTIRENIRYGVKDATDEQVMEAAEIANVKKFAEKLPKGFDELVGEKGSAVSGGQRQRIAIARAVIKNPVMLVTDEATSALDASSERKVQLALDKVMNGRTSVVVAHRLSTIRNAHVIYVFDDGEIREKGNHDELIALRGCYFNLVQRQLTQDTKAAAVKESESSELSSGTVSSLSSDSSDSDSSSSD
jgi:ABC-type multidrug transport system fused ATPase/permease subunit